MGDIFRVVLRNMLIYKRLSKILGGVILKHYFVGIFGYLENNYYFCYGLWGSRA